MITRKSNDFIYPWTAEFSDCEKYRYSLRIPFNYNAPALMVIGLNPSTATELVLDPTLTRCVHFAKDWGYGTLIMTNLFSYRATDPEVMKEQPEPIGTGNDTALIKYSKEASLILAAWGNHGAFLNRSSHVIDLLKDVHLQCLKVTNEGHPIHPLYQTKDSTPITLISPAK